MARLWHPKGRERTAGLPSRWLQRSWTLRPTPPPAFSDEPGYRAELAASPLVIQSRFTIVALKPLP